MQKLTGKTRDEIRQALAGDDRQALLDLIFSLVSFERLLTAREIADATHCNKRDVLADMKAGRFVDPIFGAGFFCRAANSFRVSASAANAWRRSFFVPVRQHDSLPAKKNNAPVETDLDRENPRQTAPAAGPDSYVQPNIGQTERLMTDQASHEGNEPGPTISATIRGEIGPNTGPMPAGEGGVRGSRPAAAGVTGKGAQKFLTKGVSL